MHAKNEGLITPYVTALIVSECVFVAMTMLAALAMAAAEAWLGFAPVPWARFTGCAETVAGVLFVTLQVPLAGVILVYEITCAMRGLRKQKEASHDS